MKKITETILGTTAMTDEEFVSQVATYLRIRPDGGLQAAVVRYIEENT